MFQGFWTNKGQKWIQNKVFQVLLKVSAWNLFDFLHEVIATLKLRTRTNTNVFLGITLFSSVLTKGIQNKIFQVLSKVTAWKILIFCMKLQQHKNLRLTKIVFWKQLYFEVFRQKGVQYEVFQGLAKVSAWTLLDFLQKITAL